MFEIKKGEWRWFAENKIVATESIDISQWSKVSKWIYTDNKGIEYEIFLPNGFFYCNNITHCESDIMMPYLDDEDDKIRENLEKCKNECKLYDEMLRYCRWLYPVEIIVEDDETANNLYHQINNINEVLSEANVQKQINEYVKDRIDRYASTEFNLRWFKNDFDKLLKYVYGEEVSSHNNRFINFLTDEKIDFLRLFILYRISKLTVKGRNITKLKLYGYQGQVRENNVRTDKKGRAVDIDDMIWNIEKGVMGGTDGALLSPNGIIKQQFYARLWCNKLLQPDEYQIIAVIMNYIHQISLTMAMDEKDYCNRFSNIDYCKEQLLSLSLFGWMIVRMFVMDKIVSWKKINMTLQWARDKYTDKEEADIHRIKTILETIKIKDSKDFINLFYKDDKRLELSDQNTILYFIFQNTNKTDRGNLRKILQDNMGKIVHIYNFQKWRILSPRINMAYLMTIVSMLYFKFKSIKLPKLVDKKFHKTTSEENRFQTGMQTMKRVLSVATYDGRNSEEWFEYVLYEAIINAMLHPYICTYCYTMQEDTTVANELDRLLKGTEKMIEGLMPLMICRNIK